MAFKSKSSTVTVSSDVVFDPHCELKTGEGSETLVLHIPDFKKDQLKVQVNNLGVLKVSGEKPLAADGKRKTRFLKEAKIPEGCDINLIRAKFSAGQLHVIMPIEAPAPPKNLQEKPETKPVSALQSKVTQNPPKNASVFDQLKSKASSSGHGLMGMDNIKESKDDVFEIGNSIARLQVKKNVAVNWGVVVALVAIGAYVAFSYGSSSSSSSPPSHTGGIKD